MTPDSFVVLHVDHEARHLDELEAAREFERNRRARYVLAHGSEDGYSPGRSFPCLGAIRELEQTEHHRVLACDGCDFETCAPLARSTTTTARF